MADTKNPPLFYFESIRYLSSRPSPLCPPSLREGGKRRNWGFASVSCLQIPNFAIFFLLLEERGRGWGKLPNTFINNNMTYPELRIGHVGIANLL